MPKEDPSGDSVTTDDAKTAPNTTEDAATAKATALADQAATSVAESDKVLRALIKEAGADEPPGLRDEKGRFAKKTEDKEPADEQQVEGEDTEEEPADQPKVDTDSEEYQTAKVALTRFRAPQSQMDLLDKGDPGILAHGLHLAKIQTDGDGFRDTHHETANKLADTEKQLTELQTAKADDKTKGTEANKSQEQSLDVASIVEPLAKHFEDTFGEDVADPVRKAFTGLAEQFAAASSESNKALRDEIRSLQKDLTRKGKQVDELVSTQTDIRNTQARKDLLKEWPQLKDDANWARVQERLKTIPTGAEWPSDYKSRVELAILGEFQAEIKDEAKQARKKNLDHKNNGTLSGSKRAASPQKARTGEELRNESLRLRMSDDEPGALELEQQLQQLQHQ